MKSMNKRTTDNESLDKRSLSIHLSKKFIVLLLCLFILFLTTIAAFAAENHVIQDNGNWSGKISNVDWTYDPKFVFNLKFNGDTIFGVIPVPSLDIGVKMKIGISGDFDLDLKRANLPANTTINSQIEKNTDNLYKDDISETLFKYLPAYYFVGFNMKSYLVAGASQPVAVKGQFNNIAEVSVTTSNGFKSNYDPDFQFTSVKPKTRRNTFVFVGTAMVETLELGKVGWQDGRCQGFRITAEG